MSKVKVLGTKYGVTITRPWSNAMYAHNDKVKAIMAANIKAAIVANSEDFHKLNEIAKSVTGYTYANGSAFEVAKDLLGELDLCEGWWLNQEYPTLEKSGYVPALIEYLVGYGEN